MNLLLALANWTCFHIYWWAGSGHVNELRNFLMIKLFLVSYIILGALNKFRLVPHRGDYDKGTAKLKNSIQVEIMIALIILFLTSILTTSNNSYRSMKTVT